ncbi:MAG: hypothetical protein JNK05_39895 [Myxococcales bacterium]|nr:hypothetical protein [Myxococcales bacterium]
MSLPRAARPSVFVALGVALCAGLANAQSAPAEGSLSQRARALAEAGLRARQAQDDATALGLFEQAYALDPLVSFRAQIGFAQQALGRWVDAERTLTEVASSDDRFVQRHRATIDEALATVRAHLGWLSVTVTPADATLSADGRGLNSGASVRIAVGSVVVRAARAGYFPVERAVTITAGQTARESIELRERPPVSSVMTVQRGTTPVVAPVRRSVVVGPTDREGVRWGGPVAVAASGAVVVGVGVGLWFVREGSLRALSSRGCLETASEWLCDPSAIDPAEARAEHQRATTSSAWSVAAMAVGGAAIAGGALWFALEATRPRRARTAFWVGPGVVRWSF